MSLVEDRPLTIGCVQSSASRGWGSNSLCSVFFLPPGALLVVADGFDSRWLRMPRSIACRVPVG
eukprot:3704708-Alexandrium_andersonii.AAC.1